MLKCNNKIFSKFLFFSIVFFLVSFFINSVIVFAAEDDQKQHIAKKSTTKENISRIQVEQRRIIDQLEVMENKL